MNRQDIADAAVFRRAVAFLAERELSATMGDLPRFVEQLRELSQRVDAVGVEQETSKLRAKNASARLAAEVRALRLEYIRPVLRALRHALPSDIARAVAPAVPRNLRQYAAVVALGHSIASAAAEHASELEGVGLAADTALRVREQLQRLQDALDHRATCVGQVAATTAGVRARINEAHAHLLLIHSLIAGALDDDPVLEAEWRSITARRRLRPSRPRVLPRSHNEAGGSE